MSGPNACWTELNVEDDPMLLQEFLGECLVDYPPEYDSMTAIMESHSTFSSASECNSSTATPNTNISTKRQKLDDNITDDAKNNEMGFIQGSGLQQQAIAGPDDDGVEELHQSSTVSTKKRKKLHEQCVKSILAERTRRQNIAQLLIALSALIPGLTKTDKVSVLGEAINHMKQLKEKLRILEEEIARRAIKPITVIKSSEVVEIDNISSACDDGCPPTSPNEQLADIEVRFSSKEILIKVHCQMQRGILIKLLSEIEKLHLHISNTSTIIFNSSTLNITILAQMELEFEMRPEELVKHLHSVFQSHPSQLV